MSNKMKYAKIINENGQITNTIPIGVDASNVDFSNGQTLIEKLNEYATKQEVNTLDSKAATKQQVGALANVYATKQEVTALGDIYTTKQEFNTFKNNIVEEFDSTKYYAKGTCVLNQGILYKLTAAHEAGVVWKNTSKVTTIISKQLKAGITIDTNNHALIIG